MRQFWTGVFIALLLVGGGVFIWQLVANEPEPLPEGRPPPVAGEAPLRDEALSLPGAMPDDAKGPPPPAVHQPSREERRFNRYDRDRDGRISRIEMLSSRTSGFRKLDKDGNNLLTFEEWAVTTAERFDEMDANGNRILTRAEFATSAPKRKPKAKCAC